MGNTCCNEAANKDNHDKNFNAKAGKPEVRDPNLDKLLEEAKSKQKEVTKIQAAFRGQKARKEVKQQ